MIKFSIITGEVVKLPIDRVLSLETEDDFQELLLDKVNLDCYSSFDDAILSDMDKFIHDDKVKTVSIDEVEELDTSIDYDFEYDE